MARGQFHAGGAPWARLPFGGDVPVDAIYASACDGAGRDGRPVEMTTIVEAGLPFAARPA